MSTFAAKRHRLSNHRLWQRLSLDSRQLVGATVMVSVLTIGVKAMSLAREVLVASHLGTTDSKDAFVTAWLIPGFLSWLVGSAIVGAMLPVFIDAKSRRTHDEMRKVLAESLAVCVVMYIAIMVILLSLGPHVLDIAAPGYSIPKLDLTHHLYLVMMPALFLTGLVTVFSGILNAENRFALAAATPAIIPVCSALGISLSPTHSVEALAWGFVAGALIQAVLTGWGVYRLGYGLNFRWHGGLPETTAMLRQMNPLIGNGIVFGGLVVVDSAMAATLGPGNPAKLAYGTMLILPIMGVTCTALGTTIFPYFAKMVTDRNWDGLENSVRTYSRWILLATLPMAAVMMLLSEQLVRLVFERGQFTAEDTASVARVQAIYALIIPIETLAVMISRVVISLRASHIMMVGSIFIFSFNVVADYFLKGWIGVEGIVLASVFNQLLSLLFLIWLWRRLLAERRAEACA